MARFQGLASAALRMGAVAAVCMGTASDARAEMGFAFHVQGSAARMVGDRKSDQFGWGGGGQVGPELTLGDRYGLDLAVGFVGLLGGDLLEPGLAGTGDGYSVYVLPGIRLRPFGRTGTHAALTASGLWIRGGGGLAYTGELARGAIDVRIGFDLFGGSAFRMGPSIGFMQIIETTSTVVPEDARVVLLGIHGAFEKQKPFKPKRPVDDDWDKDGYKNHEDGCPREPEDFDKFQDEDGCPDPDNDKDTILDEVDGCPDEPEDFDKFQDEDGCPDPDNDEDGILDDPDQCPNEPEDKDGFQDDDGCPDPDNDKDGIPDKKDKCPNDPETFNGYADDDGCPDEDNVRVVGNEIILDERVYFRVNMAAIQIRSWQILQEVAKLLKANPQYTLVRVQGHADDTGDEDYNLRLSVRRSEAVRDILIKYGVPKKQLVVEGFGERKPRRTGTSVGARRKNRRVEFLILKRKGSATSAAAGTPKKPATKDSPAKAAPKKEPSKPAPENKP